MLSLDRLVSGTINARAVGFVRMVVGTAAALKALEVAPVLARFDDPGVIRVPYVDGAPSLVDLPAAAVVGAWAVVATLFALGLAVRLTGGLLTLILLAVLVSDQQLYSNHLYLLALLVALLTIGRAGAGLSLTARGSDAVVPAWPARLIKIQVSIVYLFAALSKINVGFLSGTVVALGLRDDGPLAVPMAWRTFELMASLSIVAIMVELFLAAALWLPRWRRTAFAVGFLMHAGIAAWMEPTGQLVIFSMIILAPYMLFLDSERKHATVAWDDSCGFCGAWTETFARFDWLHVVHFVPSSDREALEGLGIDEVDAARALQLVRGGRREQGFRAVVGVLEVLPMSFLWAPLLRLSPVAWLGDRAYRRVAARRRCTVPRPQTT